MVRGLSGAVQSPKLAPAPGFAEGLIRTPFYAKEGISQIVSALFFVGLCLYVWFGALRKGKEA